MKEPNTQANVGELIDELIEQLSDDWFGIAVLIDAFTENDEFKTLSYLPKEYKIQSKLLKDEMYTTLLMRQSTLYESLLTTFLKIEIEEEIDEELTNSQESFLQRKCNPQGKVHLSYWFGIIEKKSYENLLSLMRIRGDIAHTPWLEIREENDERVQHISERIYDELEDLLEGFDALPEDTEIGDNFY